VNISADFALIIEDDAYLAEIFTRALESVGFQTEWLQDGRAALARLSQTTPAVITLDLHLPHVSGRDLLSYIRREPRLAKTRVILTTADALSAELVAPEAELVLLKPISFSQLRELAGRLKPKAELP
jgi:CheY-like chemotaxis protein